MSSKSIRITSQDSVNVIELSVPQFIDMSEFDAISEAMLGALEGKADERWVIDLTEAAYMGSAMLGLMVNVRQRIKQQQGNLIVCGMNERLHDIFRACSLERLFKIVRDRAEAMRLLRWA